MRRRKVDLGEEIMQRLIYESDKMRSDSLGFIFIQGRRFVLFKKTLLFSLM